MESLRVVSKVFAVLALVLILGVCIHYLFVAPSMNIGNAIFYYFHLLVSSLVATVVAINCRILARDP